MLTNYDKKVVELSLQGYSAREIADQLMNTNESAINSFINTLNNANHPNYNPELYSQILMEKSLKNYNVIDKDLIFKVTKMILDNYLPIEIAVLNNLTEHDFNQIIYNIKCSIYYDENTVERIKNKLQEISALDSNIKFRRILKLEKNFPNIKLEDYGFELIHYRRWQDNFKLVEEFLQNKNDITTLAMKYNIAKTTVRNILNNCDSSHFIENNFDKETCQKILKLYHSQINDSKQFDLKHKEIDPKIISITNNSRFWILFILTFRISINDLAQMFKIKDVKELHDNLFQKAQDLDNRYYRALNYLDYNNNSQNLPVAINFYKEYMDAKKNNIEKAKEMIKVIDDHDFIVLMNSKKRIDKMSAAEHRMIADNWVKFALSCRDFPYKLCSLDKYCMPYHEEEIKKIKEYNLETSKISQRLVCQRINRGYNGNR